MDQTKYRTGILNQIYSELQGRSVVKNRRDFADRVHYDYCCMSSALNGNPKYLTDKLFRKVFSAFNELDPANYPLSPAPGAPGASNTAKSSPDTATGTMTQLGEINKMILLLEQQQQLTANSQIQIDKLIKSVDKLVDQICRMASIPSNDIPSQVSKIEETNLF